MSEYQQGRGIMPRRILLLYISNYSGHHRASIAIEMAFKRFYKNSEVLSLNAFNYTNPIIEKVINKAYMGVIKGKPEIWEYLYDNPKVLKKIKGLREAIHRYNSPKLKKLIEEFSPHGVICTQAFPCGMIADYKKSSKAAIPLIGVLTDFAPHLYWIYDNVDAYIVPAEETGKRLIENGVFPEKIKSYGIPIDPKFNDPRNNDEIHARLGLSSELPVVLIMGGSQGIGLIKEVVVALNGLPNTIQIIVIAGKNRALYQWINGRTRIFKHKTVVFSFVENVEEFMSIATLIITKPGGITASEALCMGLPMLILHPLPGQETMNTNFLLEKEVAIRADDQQDAALIVESLLSNQSKLLQMKSRAKGLATPESAFRIAKHMLELTK